MRKLPAALALAVFAAGLAAPASASFHLMKVVEIFPGTAAAPNAQYVVLQMYSPGQDFVGGHAVTVFNSAGTLVATFTFGSDVANGASQDKILIATPEAVTFFGLSADLVMTPAMIKAGGKVCFSATIDCVAWGSWAGGATGVGTPYQAVSGLRSGHAAKRRLDIAGSATVLDGLDDTNDSANDFIDAVPAPKNNARVLGTIPAATCGNGAIEGLEECDDGNLVNGDGCSATCLVTPAAPALSIADASTSEGDAGTKQLDFTVSLAPVAAGPVSFDVATDTGTAAPGIDYVAKSSQGVVIPAGQSSAQFSVTINGDTTVEDNESIAVTLSNASGAGISRAQGVGRIVNDDLAALSIDDVTVLEGPAGTTVTARFLVHLSSPMPTPVTFDIATSSVTATAGSDYISRGQLGRIIDAGRTTVTFEVAVLGDNNVEPDETFSVSLSSVVGATIADGSAVGTIVNDDAPAAPAVATQAVGSKLAPDLRLGQLDLRRSGSGLPAARGSTAEALRLARLANTACATLHAPDVLLVSGLRGADELALLTAAINGHDANLLFPGSCAAELHYRAIAAPATHGAAGHAVLLREIQGTRLSVAGFPDRGHKVALRIGRGGAATEIRLLDFPP